MYKRQVSHFAAKFVPHILTNKQTQILADVSKEFLTQANEDVKFLKDWKRNIILK